MRIVNSSVLALALGAFVVGGLAGCHGYVEEIDTQGNHHRGYYDERHDWHGGYYDGDHHFHDDPHDWRRDDDHR